MIPDLVQITQAFSFIGVLLLLNLHLIVTQLTVEVLLAPFDANSVYNHFTIQFNTFLNFFRHFFCPLSCTKLVTNCLLNSKPALNGLNSQIRHSGIEFIHIVNGSCIKQHAVNYCLWWEGAESQSRCSHPNNYTSLFFPSLPCDIFTC